MTPLHVAVRNCCLEAVSLLLGHGADPNRPAADGQSPLELAASIHFHKGLEAMVLSLCRIGHFELLRYLGGGSNGAVLLCKCTHPRHPFPNKHYALKMVFNYGGLTSGGIRSRFEAEFDLFGSLGGHARLVKFWGSFVDAIPDVIADMLPEDRTFDKRHLLFNDLGVRRTEPLKSMFAVFDYHPESLLVFASRVPAGTVLSRDVFYRTGKQLLQAWEWMKREGLLHRDAKPDNVLVKANGAVCIADLGEAIVLVQ